MILQLSYQAQRIIVIVSLKFELEQIEIPIALEFWRKNHKWDRALENVDWGTKVQCGAVITRSIFSQILIIGTHTSPVWF